MILRLMTIVMLSVAGVILAAPAEAETGRSIITAQNVHLLEKLAQFERGNLIEPFWSPDGQYIFVTGSLGIWRFEADNLENPPQLFDQYFDLLTFSPDNQTAASVNADGDIVFWDIHTGDLIEMFYDPGQSLWKFADLVFSPDGKLLAASINGSTNIRPDGAVSVWDVETHEQIFFVREVVSPAEVAFSVDGSRLVTGGYMGLTLHDTTTWENLSVPDGSSIINPGMSKDGRWLAYWEWRNGHPVVINLLQGEELRCNTENNPLRAGSSSGDIVFSPRDADVAAISHNGSLILWNANTCETLLDIPASIRLIAFNPQGTKLAGVSAASLYVYDTSDLHEIVHTDGFMRHIGEMTFSADSTVFAYEHRNANWQYADAVRAWRTDDYSELAWITPEINRDEIENPFLRDNVEPFEYATFVEGENVTYSFPALRLKNVSGLCTISGWYPRYYQAEIIRTTAPANSPVQTVYDAHDYPVAWLCISPDQRILVTGDTQSRSSTVPQTPLPEDAMRSVQVWDLTSGNRIMTLLGMPTSSEFTDPYFSADGRYFSLTQNSLRTVWDTSQWIPVESMATDTGLPGRFTVGFDVYISPTEYGDVDFLAVETGERLWTIEDLYPADILVSPDGTLVAFKRSNLTVELWGLPSAD